MTVKNLQTLGRAKNAVLDFWGHKLFIPKIYIDATWSGEQVDLLAIDRSGVGDIHVGLFFQRSSSHKGTGPDTEADDEQIDALLERFKGIQANWKYIVAVEEESEVENYQPRLSRAMRERALSPDGIGRTAVLHVDFPPDEGATTTVVLKPERFRARVAAIAEDFVMQHTPDWEIRDTPLV